MILDFRFANFRSFHDEARLCLCDEKGMENIAAIYGANASGKTNVIKALSMMRSAVLENAGLNSADTLPYQPFAFVPNEESPYLSELTFLIDEKVYRFGYQLIRTGITSEWLCMSDSFADYVVDREHIIYRYAGETLEGDRADELRQLLPRKRPNMFLLSKLDQENDGLAGSVIQWFKNLVIVKAYTDGGFYSYSHRHILMADYRKSMMGLVCSADSTIVDVAEAPIGDVDAVTHKVPSQIRFVRKTVDGTATVQLPFDDFESAGTQKMFLLSGPFVDILRNGYTVVFDELDARFHPLLTRALIGHFTDPKRNPKGAQLIFTTHDVELIRSGAIKRGHVFFCDKNPSGESALYGLSDFETSSSYSGQQMAEKYLEGVFGAVPSLEGGAYGFAD